jgi:hypothetical protein
MHSQMVLSGGGGRQALPRWCRALLLQPESMAGPLRLGTAAAQKDSCVAHLQ